MRRLPSAGGEQPIGLGNYRYIFRNRILPDKNLRGIRFTLPQQIDIILGENGFSRERRAGNTNTPAKHGSLKFIIFNKDMQVFLLLDRYHITSLQQVEIFGSGPLEGKLKLLGIPALVIDQLP